MPKVSTSWKEGQSGNPNGRPKKGYSITEWFQEMLDSKPEVKDAIGKSILKKALEGDIAAQKLVWNYVDGMPVQKQQLGGLDGEDLQINIKVIDDKHGFTVRDQELPSSTNNLQLPDKT